MLFIEAIESVRCFDEGVIESVADANIGSIMGIGLPALDRRRAAVHQRLRPTHGSQAPAWPASSPAPASSPPRTASASSRRPRWSSAPSAASPTATSWSPPSDLSADGSARRGGPRRCRSTPPDNLAQRCVGEERTVARPGRAALGPGRVDRRRGRRGRSSRSTTAAPPGPSRRLAATRPSRPPRRPSTHKRKRRKSLLVRNARAAAELAASTRARCRSSSTTPSARRRPARRSRVCTSPTATSRRRWPG